MEFVPILFVVGLCIAGAVVTALKGKPWCLVGGFFIGWLAESKTRFNKDSGFEAAPAYDPTRY